MKLKIICSFIAFFILISFSTQQQQDLDKLRTTETNTYYDAHINTDQTEILLKTQYGKLFTEACLYFGDQIEFPCNLYLSIPLVKLFNFMGNSSIFQKLAFLVSIKSMIILNDNKYSYDLTFSKIKNYIGKTAETSYKMSLF